MVHYYSRKRIYEFSDKKSIYPNYFILIKNNEIIPFEVDHKFYEIGNKKSFKILLNKLKTINLEQLWNE